MDDVKITVGGRMEQDASRRFIDAWHRAERGDTFNERHLAFESWDTLARVLTTRRMELLRYVRQHKVASIRALAKALGRGPLACSTRLWGTPSPPATMQWPASDGPFDR